MPSFNSRRFGFPDCHRLHPDEALQGIYAEADFSCAQKVTRQDSVRIACVGDSITAGFRATDRNHTYPSQLQNLLDDAFGDDTYSVTNLGAVGACMEKGTDYSYENWPQMKALLGSLWHIIIIMLGTNDAKGFVNTCITDTNCKFIIDYKEFISVCSQLGPAEGQPPKIFVMTPPPLMMANAGGFGLDQTEINSDLPQIIPQLLDQSAVTGFIDIFRNLGGVSDWYTQWPPQCSLQSPELACQWFCNLDTCDQIHPNNDGYRHIAEVVIDGMSEVHAV